MKNVGDDYRDMYLMMDHGLFVELGRPEVFEDIVLYSGITPQRVAEIAGLDKSTASVSDNQLVDVIGSEYIDSAMMSTTADVDTAISFSGSSNTIIKIYASRDALNDLGCIDIDCMSSMFAGEEETLLNKEAEFKVLDVGTITSGDLTRRCIVMELLGGK